MLSVTLDIELEEQKVNVDEESGVGSNPGRVGSTLVLRKKDLEALPDDQIAFEQTLKQLAGPTLTGGELQVTVNGFSNGRIPPKNAIREVRVNNNLFSAKNSSLNSSGIEIYTNSGSDEFHGDASFRFGDESLNARNPFALKRAPYQSRQFDLSLDGPLVPKRASFSVNASFNSNDTNSVINAITLDPSLLITQLNETFLAPSHSYNLATSVNFNINKKHSLSASYFHNTSRQNLTGVGGFDLQSRASRSINSFDTLQLSERATLSKRLINETRFQFESSQSSQKGLDNSVALIVQDAFSGGGAQANSSFNTKRFEFQNYTTWERGRHTLEFGGEAHGVWIANITRANFGGTYTFSGGIGPVLDTSNQPLVDISGNIITTELSSIERYRRTLLFSRLNYTPTQIRALGGGASQFSIAGGNPNIEVKQYDIGIFLQDSWSVCDNLSLGLGLRYQNQTNIHSPLNFAPRISIAWSPRFSNKSSQQNKQKPAPPATPAAQNGMLGFGRMNRAPLTIRVGFGVFFQRVDENFALETRQFNGITQQQYIVNDPSVLDLFPLAPSIELLSAYALPQTTQDLSLKVQAPYSLTTTITIEKGLPYGFFASVSFNNSRTLHFIRMRNINAPLAGTFDSTKQNSGVRPLGNTAGNIYQYESSGIIKTNGLTINIRRMFSRNFTFFGTYRLRKSSDNLVSGSGSPFDPYDFSDEFAASNSDVRHGLNFSANYRTPFGFSFNARLGYASGTPLNIITGRDTNGDNFFAERPAYATDLSKPGVVITPYGALDPNPLPGARIIQRNLGRGPSVFNLSMGMSKSFVFAKDKVAKANSNQSGGNPYRLTFDLYASNILNHPNFGNPSGNLSSPYFLRSNTSASFNSVAFIGGGPRQMSVGLRFSF